MTTRHSECCIVSFFMRRNLSKSFVSTESVDFEIWYVGFASLWSESGVLILSARSSRPTFMLMSKIPAMPSQLVKLLASRFKNICVIGMLTSLFWLAWGWYAEYLGFDPNAKVVLLRENYRSTKPKHSKPPMEMSKTIESSIFRISGPRILMGTNCGIIVQNDEQDRGCFCSQNHWWTWSQSKLHAHRLQFFLSD